MLVNEVTSAGATPALETVMKFAAQRQRMIASNIANISTPDYRQKDVSVEGFQAALREAVDRRRSATGGDSGELEPIQTREVTQGPGGELRLKPSEPARNILFHDRGNRNIERLMQDQVENAMVFRAATELLRSRYELMRSAISERV